MEMDNNLPIKDNLALERTKLANERTFLAYFRSSVVFLSSGVAIFRIEALNNLKEVGIGLIILGPLLLTVGFVRFLMVKKKLKGYLEPSQPPSN